MLNFAPLSLPDYVRAVDSETGPRWLLKDFLAADSLTMLSGHPKVLGKKTLIAMTQALALASGKTLAAFEPSLPTPVLYLYHEGARKATRHRIRMLCQGAGIDEMSLTELFLAHRCQMDMRSKADVSVIGNWAKSKKVGLVIFDTLAKSMQGDEDSSENIGRVVRGVEEARSYGVSVLILHHLSKSSTSMVGGNYDPDRDMRGSGALAGAYETHQAVRHYSYNNTRTDLLVSNKDGEEFAHKHWFEFINAKHPDGADDVANCQTILHMGPRIKWEEIGNLDEDERKALLEVLKTQTSYTIEMLTALWKVERRVAFDLLAKLVAYEALESAKYGYRIKE